MVTMKTYYCDACKKEIKNSFPGMKLYWDNAVPYLGRKIIELKHICDNCTEVINEYMNEVDCNIKKLNTNMREVR